MKLNVGKYVVSGREWHGQNLTIHEFPAAMAFLFVDVRGGWFGDVQSERNASQVATAVIVRRLQEFLADNARAGRINRHGIQECVRRANADIIAANQQQTDEGTIVGASILMVVWPHGPEIHVVGIGDCRAYLWRTGNLALLTTDDTLEATLPKSGTSEEEAARFRAHLYRFLGSREVESWDGPEVSNVSVQHKDILLLTNSGLHSCVSENKLREILRATDDAQICAETLCSQAQLCGGRGDIAAMVIEALEV